MANSEPMVVYAATYDSTSAALADLGAIDQLHTDQVIGTVDAAVIDRENGKPHIHKRMDRPASASFPRRSAAGPCPRKELTDAASDLSANEAGLIAVGEPTVEKALDHA